MEWLSVTPLGIARASVQDDEYNGFFIPKGATLMPNVWSVPHPLSQCTDIQPSDRAMLHDPAVYPNPLQFDPDRFADEKRNKELGINEFPRAAFGFGRRQVASDVSGRLHTES